MTTIKKTLPKCLTVLAVARVNGKSVPCNAMHRFSPQRAIAQSILPEIALTPGVNHMYQKQRIGRSEIGLVFVRLLSDGSKRQQDCLTFSL